MVLLTKILRHCQEEKHKSVWPFIKEPQKLFAIKDLVLTVVYSFYDCKSRYNIHFTTVNIGKSVKVRKTTSLGLKLFSATLTNIKQVRNKIKNSCKE